jgi:cobalt-zinc-cadmium efflux system outer membrane protein
MNRNAGRASVLLPLTTLVCACLQGCGGDGAQTGRQILMDLEHRQIPLPTERGEAPAYISPGVLPAAGPVRLADLLRVAESHSPRLAAARTEIGIAAGELWQASLYPNPRLDVNSEDISWRDGVSESKTTVGVTQPVILGKRREAAMDAAAAEREARAADVEAARRDVYGAVVSLYATIISAREQRALYQELRESASKTLSAAQTRFDAKAAPETDVIRPRVELHRVDAATARLDQEIKTASAQLGVLLGGVTVDPARLEGAIPASPEPLDADAMAAAVRTSHPSLAAADREIEAAEARVERGKAERTPDLDIRVAAGYSGERDEGIVEVGAGVTLPLWDAREGSILSFRFGVVRARHQRAVIEQELLERLAGATGEYEAARAQLGTFRENIVPDAQRAFDQSGEGYRAGRSSFLDMLDAQRTLTEARIAMSELASAANAARAKVIQIVGPEALAMPNAASGEVPLPSPQSPIQERPQGAEVKQ